MLTKKLINSILIFTLLLVIFSFATGNKILASEEFSPTCFFLDDKLLLAARSLADHLDVSLVWAEEEGRAYLANWPVGGRLLAGNYYAQVDDIVKALGAKFNWSETNDEGQLLIGGRTIHLKPIRSPKFNEASPLVYLTFDDGPNASIPAILEILEIFGVKAVFFLVGENVAMYTDYGRDLIAAGHQIGNHTYSHPHLSLLSEEEIFEELLAAEMIFQSKLNLGAKIFRPPYGDHNYLVQKVVKDLGLKQILWDINPGDYLLPGTEAMVKMIGEELKPNASILLHCKLATAQALPAIIEMVWSQGYTFALYP